MISKRQPVGFHAISQEEPSKEPTIDEFMTLLSKETTSAQEFEGRLYKELKDVKDMESNLKQITIQVESMQKLLTAREDLFRKLVDERNKGINMNIEECDNLLNNIGKINQDLGASINIARGELSKLFIEQKDLMYLESENTRAIMNNISDRAKKLNTEILIISKYQNSLSDVLNQIYEEISKIRFERTKKR